MKRMSVMEVARPGTRWSKKTVWMIAGQMKSIKRANGGSLTPELVLDRARDEESPLHRFFEWDDSVAAERFRLAQASALIRVVYVVVKLPGEAPLQPVRAEVCVTDRDGEQAYVSAIEAMRVPAFTAQVLARARAEMEGWISRYENFQQLRKAVSSAKRVLAKLEEVE